MDVAAPRYIQVVLNIRPFRALFLVDFFHNLSSQWPCELIREGNVLAVVIRNIGYRRDAAITLVQTAISNLSHKMLADCVLYRDAS